MPPIKGGVSLLAYVTVPRDLTKIKSEVLFGLTKRQLAYSSSAVFMGAPLFFLFKGSTGTSTASFCAILAVLPFFLLGMYERNGEPLEVIAKHFIRTKFLLSRERPYQTNSFYAVLMWQDRLEEEVKAIVKNKKNYLMAKTDPCTKMGNRKNYP